MDTKSCRTALCANLTMLKIRSTYCTSLTISISVICGPACRVAKAGALGPRNPSCHKGKPDSDTVSSTTWIRKRTITVEGDGAVLSRIMHIVTLAVRDFVDLLYIEVIQNLQFVSLPDFSGFLCKVSTRQKRKIDNSFCVFLFCLLQLRVPPTCHTLKCVSYGF